MSETTNGGDAESSPAVPSAPAAAPAADERLAYRSVFQRLFVQPEIGAIIGVIGVWAFFWAVSLNFGTAGQTQNWLDTASTLGIMAVAVSMLMIGGEFDLSSGANTGAMGILFILLIKEVGDLGGLGLSIWIAVPASFIVAMAIGYFNGWMVERTALPSFIVTLATFFILRGLKLGLAKLLTGQISVTFTNDAHGYEFFRPIFAGEWQRNEHVWNGRDIFYLGGLIGGAVVLTLSVCQLNFVRRAGTAPARPGLLVLGVFLAGAAIVVPDALTGAPGLVAARLLLFAAVLLFLASFDRLRVGPIASVPVSFAAAGAGAAIALISLLVLSEGDLRTSVASVLLFLAIALAVWSLLSDRVVGGRTADEPQGPVRTIGMFVGVVLAVSAAVSLAAHVVGDESWTAGATAYLIALVAGVILIAFTIPATGDRERGPLNAAGLLTLALGACGVAGSFALFQLTNGVGANLLASVVLALATVVGLFGFGMLGFENVESAGGLQLDPGMIRYLSGGVAAVAVAAVCSFVVDSSNSDTLFFPFTVQGLRVVLMMVFAAGGCTLLMIGANRALRINPATKLFASAITAAALVVFAFVIRQSAEAAKFRTEMFAAMLFAALALMVWSLLGMRFAERRSTDSRADRAGMRGLLIGVLLVVIAVVLRHLFVTQDELDAGVNPAKFSVRMLWFFAFTATMVWILRRTRFGSWTFAVGGNKEAARQVGVPAARTKTQLFMIASGAAWLAGMLLAFRLNSLQAGAGDGEEFEYIIAAVVGGTMLTGGYGTALGASFGAAIMAMSLVGIQAARWNTDWRFVFLGVILLLAVIANRFIRDKAEAAGRR